MFRSTTLACVLMAWATCPSLAASGSFEGASGHTTSGTVEVTEKNGRVIIKLGSNFSLESAPDPYVALGADARPVKGGTAGKLENNTGAGSYVVPATATTRAARQVVIWCRQYEVPLGIAELN